MTKMTAGHVAALLECAKNDREWASWVTPTRARVKILDRAARLSEVAAHLAAQIEGADDAG